MDPSGPTASQAARFGASHSPHCGAAKTSNAEIAAPGCGLWLTPNLVACQAVGPLGSLGALAAAVGLGYAAYTIRRHAISFVR